MAKALTPAHRGIDKKVADFIITLVSEIPESQQEAATDPETRAREIISSAALRSAAISGTLSLPPGPLGLVAILPDLKIIWKVQAQLVSDLAALYGKTELTREKMLYCLFRHSAAHAFKDLIARAGERVLVKRATLRGLQKITRVLGIKVTQRVAGKVAVKWLPLIGAMGVAGYAYYDTWQVGQSAMKLFRSEEKK